MRNDRRRDIREKDRDIGMRKAIYIAGIILALGVISFFITVSIYNNNLEKMYSDLEKDNLSQKIAQSDTVADTEEASSKIGKSANEMMEQMENSILQNENTQNESQNQIVQNVASEQTTANTVENNVQSSTNSEEQETKPGNQEVNNEGEQKQEEKEPVFAMPVEGNIIKEYAKDKLVYSETLKEWIVHTGIDIEAEKTTVVKAAESGKVTAIKNDPRYGITVIVEHSNGYETRYANLLTAEFVQVGEEVTKGQTLGTVGNTSTFEILDNYHLHFEILKDGEYQDPQIFF